MKMKIPLFQFPIVLSITVALLSSGCDKDDTGPADSGTEARTLIPCALLTDAQAETAMGDVISEMVSDAKFDFITCQYLGEFRMGEGLPNLFIQARTDKSIQDYGSGENARIFWNNFLGDVRSRKTTEVSPTQYYIEEPLMDSAILVEEITDLGAEALYFMAGDPMVQLWFYRDFAVFSLSLTLRTGQKGPEMERLKTVAAAILTAMP